MHQNEEFQSIWFLIQIFFAVIPHKNNTYLTSVFWLLNVHYELVTGARPKCQNLRFNIKKIPKKSKYLLEYLKNTTGHDLRSIAKKENPILEVMIDEGIDQSRPFKCRARGFTGKAKTNSLSG